MILIIVFPTILVAVGATWAAYDEFHRTRKSERRSALTASKHHEHAKDDECIITECFSLSEISILDILMWFSVVCGMLLLMYSYYDYMVNFIITSFCITGSLSLYKCLHPLWSRIVPITYLIPTNKLPCVCSKVKLKDLMLLMLCLTVGIYWVIERHASYAWSILDLLGATICISYIRIMRLPNLKVIMVLMILLLVYDVFFVFVTPLFTSDGISIMESVATGDAGQSEELLPMAFFLPIFYDSPSLGDSFSFMGFGDVIVPGFIVAYNAVFDIKTGSGMVYFICSSVGYFTGMVVCFTCLICMGIGQPALLYLVPGTLVSTVVVAVIRQEFLHLFFGQHLLPQKADGSIEPGNVDSSEDRYLNDKGVYKEQEKLIN